MNVRYLWKNVTSLYQFGATIYSDISRGGGWTTWQVMRKVLKSGENDVTDFGLLAEYSSLIVIIQITLRVIFNY
jgi:hypothetical protein